jgi:hypothetical protein
MKVGLSNHQPVCVPPQYLLYRLVDFQEMWCTGTAIQGDLEATSLNLVASATPE